MLGACVLPKALQSRSLPVQRITFLGGQKSLHCLPVSSCLLSATLGQWVYVTAEECDQHKESYQQLRRDVHNASGTLGVLWWLLLNCPSPGKRDLLNFLLHGFCWKECQLVQSSIVLSQSLGEGDSSYFSGKRGKKIQPMVFSEVDQHVPPRASEPGRSLSPRPVLTGGACVRAASRASQPDTALGKYLHGPMVEEQHHLWGAGLGSWDGKPLRERPNQCWLL